MSSISINLIDERDVLGEQFKMYGTYENPLFLAKDVANWISHSNVTMMLNSIDDEEKVKLNNTYFEDRTGGNGTMFLTEDGLYEVLMQSRKPIAKQFKKEVKKILKEIRITGSYSSGISQEGFTLQAIKTMVDNILQTQEENKLLNLKVNNLENQVDNIEDIITKQSDWSKFVHGQLNKLSGMLHIPQAKLYNDIYNQIENKLNVNLHNQLVRYRKRLLLMGWSKTKSKSFNKIRLIEQNVKFRNEFEQIVKNKFLSNGVNI